MPGHIKVGGAWKAFSKMHVKVSGTWKEVQSGYVKVSGTWKEFFSGETYTLSGTSGSPNIAANTETSPTNSLVSWIFNTDGTVDKDEGGTVTQFQAGTEWSDAQPTPGADMWLRATLDSGDTTTAGDTLGVWLKVAGSGSANRTFTWEETTDGFANTIGTIQAELATDSGGTNIVATGYYRGTASVEL